MADLEENAFQQLDGKINSVSEGVSDILNFLMGELTKQFQQIDGQFQRMDERFQQMDERFQRMDEKLDTLATKEQVDGLAKNLKALENDVRVVETVSFKTAGDVVNLKRVQ